MSPTLASKLTALTDSNKATSALIQRLSKLSFQPGATPLYGEEGDVRVELSQEIHESLKQQEEDLELLRQEVEEVTAGSRIPNKRRDSEKNREQARLAVQVARLGEDLKNLRSQFRQAQLQAKRSAEQAKQKERQLLFSGIQEGSTTPTGGRRRGQEKLSADEVLVNATSDVTTALRRTHQLMKSELSRSRFAQETLEQSTAALQDLSEKYGSLDSLLTNSRTLVTTLLKSQKSDTWYLETALYILITTIVWLIFRRLLYGPLWWFVYLPIKLGFKVLAFFTSAIGLTGSATTSVASSPTRKPLIVKPSATDKPPRRPNYQDATYHNQGAGVPVGAGGRGAKTPPKDPSPDGSMSQKVGQMAESAKEAVDSSNGNKQGAEEPKQALRGDGQPLQDSDKPRNPKKRMFDTNIEDEKQEAAQRKDEL